MSTRIAEPVHVRHGYTMTDLDRLARTVVVANAQWWRGGDRFDQAAIAWSGIAEHLCAAEVVPSPNDLLAAGTRALADDVKGWRRSHGMREQSADVGPRFAAFWYEAPAQPWDERVVESIAVHQVLEELPAHQRDAVIALATYEDYGRAAEALGIKYPTLTARLRLARQTLARLWYAPETAPRTRHTDRRVGSYTAEASTHCGAGHAWTLENTRWAKGRTAASAKVRRCRSCERERKARARPAPNPGEGNSR